MRSNYTDAQEKAKHYAFLLLKFRLRSEYELYQRLKKKKFADSVIKQVLLFLKQRGFIDDSAFASAWIRGRISRPLGLRRLKQELRAKGIDKEIIEDQFEQLKNSYSEKTVVNELAAKKMEKLKEVDSLKAKRRIYAFLLRRGFSPDLAMEAVNRL